MTEVNVGLILIMVSIIGLALSFRKRKTAPNEAGVKTSI